MSAYKLRRLGQLMAVIHRDAHEYQSERTALVILRWDALGQEYWEEVEDTPVMGILAKEIWAALSQEDK